MGLTTLENRIATEWGGARAFVALHPVASLLIAFAAGAAAVALKVWLF